MGRRKRTPAPVELRSKEWLEEAYVAQGHSGPTIAGMLGLPDASLVYRYLDRHDIPRRPKSARSGFAGTVEEGIDATRKADQRHKRRPTIPFFMARVKAVVGAKAAKQHVALRGALIDLAALCQVWAEEVPFSTILKEA
jgi:hypothetical protein